MEQKDISLSYGIRRSPSIGNDGELSECVNLIPKNGELVNIQPPKSLGITLPANSTLMYVHRTKEFVHYIFFQTNVLRYVDTDGTTHLIGANQYDKIPKSVVSIGNTLIVLTDDPISYLIWEDGFYKELGQKPPFPNISFGLRGSFEKTDEVTMNVSADGWTGDFSEGQLSEISNAIMGHVSKFIREKGVESDRFLYPFFIRYAYRLYDGTSYMQSAPILMIPSSGINPHVPFKIDTGLSDFDLQIVVKFIVASVACSIDYKVSGMGHNRRLWSDIVKSLDIFVSPMTYTFDYYGQVSGTQTISGDNGFGVYSLNGGLYARTTFYEAMARTDPFTQYSSQFVLPGKPMDNRIPESSLFYRIASISYDDLCDQDGGSRRTLSIETGALDGLESNVELKDSDGYQNHDYLIPGYSYTYNQRLNLANIKRVLFGGFAPESMVAFNDGSSPISVKVFIREDNREIVTETTSAYSMGINLYYIYYPNSNAYKAVITRRSDGYQVSVPLTPHNLMNGAYYFNSFVPLLFKPGSDNTPVSSDRTVEMPNKVYTSEVNNPFYFPLAGINTVGTGEILGIRSTTKALSQGQFGQFPLYVFSTDGIWAMQLSDIGLYSSIQPVSRDVCNNPSSITQLDSAIAFASAKGLMLLQGSDVTLISGQMRGKNVDETLFNVNPDFSALFVSDTDSFVHMLASCRMAYDYSNSLLHIYPAEGTKHYVYSLETSEFAAMVDDPIKAFANDYPDPVLQKGDILYSLERYESGDIRSGMVITRPIAFGDPFSLKTLVDLRSLGERTNQNSTIRIAVFVSEDKRRWSRLKSLRQRAFKYYRFVYYTKMADIDTLSGTRVWIETRRDNKLR